MNKTFSIILVLLLGLGGFMFWQNRVTTPEVNPLGEKMVVYKTPQCGCCAVYIKYLEKKGVEVEVVSVPVTTEIRAQYGIPVGLSSCHTSVVGGYGVEGHVPLEVIQKLLAEQPDIKAVTLPGMPTGTPGMPGPKTAEWVINAIDLNGEVTEFMRM